MKSRLDIAIDFGCVLPDKKPLFGKSKTWRGVVGALIFTSASAVLLGYSLSTGAQVAIFAVAGDVFSSFIKRRLGMAPSSMAPLLDQVPESLFPAVMLMHTFNLDMQAIIILVSAFVIAELILSSVLFKVGIRNRPY